MSKFEINSDNAMFGPNRVIQLRISIRDAILREQIVYML